MRIGSRFRRLVGIFGAMSVVIGTITGAALTIGQGAASAASSAWSLDLGTPTVIFQNVTGQPGLPPVGPNPATPPFNAGDGWNFIASGWAAGDTITITIGTANGGPGVECNTNDLSNPATPGFGVNQTDDDMSNFVLFNGWDAINSGPSSPLLGPPAFAGDPTSSIIESTGGSTAPFISTRLGNQALSPNGQPCGPHASDSPASHTSDQLILTFLNTVSPLTTAQVFVGYANVVGSPASAVSAPVVYTTGFGATGGFPMSGLYTVAGDSTYQTTQGPPNNPTPGASSAVTVPANAIVAGETPGANNPSSGVQRITSTAIVPPSVIPPFTITDVVGDMLPPNPAVIPGFGPFGPQTVGIPPAPGVVCLQIDNSTQQNLGFLATPTWSVSPNAGTNSFSAATGGPIVVGGVGGAILQLPVVADNSPGQATTWTTSALTIGTDPFIGNHTHADGPVWAFVWYVSGAIGTASCDSTGIHTVSDPGGNIVDQEGDQPGPGIPGSNHSSAQELGYVQLTTVSELANRIFGQTQVDTAAQAIGHQFNYAAGECIGGAAFASHGGPIFLATDADYHDALGAAYPAGADTSGVALTDPTSLSPAAANIIRQEGVETVYLVGGNQAISDGVENTLASMTSYQCGGVNPRFNLLGGTENLTVIRIAGPTADDTNLQLADFVGAQPPTPTPGPFGAYAMPTLFNDTGAGISTAAPSGLTQNTALLVTDAGFQDAVSASALAYGWPMPLITTTPGALSTDALAAISNNHINQVILLGGAGAVSDNVVNQLNALGVAVIRVAGIDGSDSSVQLAAFELAAGQLAPLAPFIGLGVDNNDFNWGHFVARTAGEINPDPNFLVTAHAVLLARGDYYADAETASVLAVHNGLFGENTTLKPLILDENPSTLGTYVTTFLNDAGLAVSTLAGEAPANGWQGDPSFGNQVNNSSSNVYTIQPIGGSLALGAGVLSAAIAAVTAG